MSQIPVGTATTAGAANAGGHTGDGSPRYREMRTSAGVPLLLTDSVTAQVLRLAEITRLTGIPEDAFVIDPMCSVPLPRYEAFDATTQRRWAGLKPESMWHPLLWLPERVARRQTYIDPVSGLTKTETDRLWAIRVAIELQVSGLYDPLRGWLDVLSVAGLDADDDLDQARIGDWLDGEPDEILDSIDLTVFTEFEPTNYALSDAIELLPVLEQAAWAQIADESFAATQAALLGPDDNPLGPRPDVEEQRELIVNACLNGITYLGDVPLRTDSGESTAPGESVETHSDFFVRACLAAEQTSDQGVMDSIREAVAARCVHIREAYWGVVEVLNSLIDAETTGTGTGAQDGRA